jgi:hypothetical protein
MTVDGVENMIAVSGAIVSANYSYTYNWSNSSGNTENGQKSGTFTFSSTSFHYINVTDDQIGYVNPTIWFAMNNALPVGSTSFILNTQMTILSKNESDYLQTNQPVMVDSS